MRRLRWLGGGCYQLHYFLSQTVVCRTQCTDVVGVALAFLSQQSPNRSRSNRGFFEEKSNLVKIMNLSCKLSSIVLCSASELQQLLNVLFYDSAVEMHHFLRSWAETREIHTKDEISFAIASFPLLYGLQGFPGMFSVPLCTGWARRLRQSTEVNDATYSHSISYGCSCPPCTPAQAEKKWALVSERPVDHKRTKRLRTSQGQGCHLTRLPELQTDSGFLDFVPTLYVAAQGNHVRRRRILLSAYVVLCLASVNSQWKTSKHV